MGCSGLRKTIPALLLGVGSAYACGPAAPPPPAPLARDAAAVIPRPAYAVAGDGELRLGPSTRITVDPAADPRVQQDAERWAARVRAAAGIPLEVGPGGPAPDAIHIVASAEHESLGEEGYRLEVSGESATITAAAPAGAFYGLQTLRQLLPAALANGESTDATWSIPAVRIEDEPRFRYRGMHLDVGRHFFPVEFIREYLDLMALYKFNTFHWHLTEDQGWRIEIERYPRLTEVGAWREETMVEKNSDPYVGDGTRYGGFYTQDEIRDVVRYAAERHITIIPEIEMPGHSMAALAAYPELACTPGPFEVGTRWGVYEDIYCPKEETFTFLENVLLEVMDLFPGTYIHIGGDEAPKERWVESPLAQEVIRREGLADEAELQSWFIRRIEEFLAQHGRRLIGWDEILEGGLPPRATVMSWRGINGGIEAARLGHDVIMTPTSHLYFDYYQADPEDEPLAIGGFLPLDSVYAYEPIPEVLSAEEARHVLGAQGNVWTEYMRTPEHVEYMVFPRLLALAEVVWSPRDRRDWASFQARLPAALARLDALGVNYRPPTTDAHTR